MQAGDFMLATNILLSGSNYSKVALLFKLMNMGMVDRSTYHTIQDTYCVDTIKEVWKDKRVEIVHRLQDRDVVIVGEVKLWNLWCCSQKIVNMLCKSKVQ